MKRPATRHRVSPNNPCPFLRALVSEGLLDNTLSTVGDATAAIERVACTGEGSPSLPGMAIRLIAVLANGVEPGTVLQSAIHGVKLNALRNGPFDKKGAGSRILNSRGVVSEAQLERLKEFASLKHPAHGSGEPGLDAGELQAMMDANYQRAAGHRRLLDRTIMEGEWPILLEVMGKEGKQGRYLSLREIWTLFVQRQLPERMLRRLGN